MLQRLLALHFQDEEESPCDRRRNVVGGASLLSSEMNRHRATSGQIEMPRSLLAAGRTERRALAALPLADEHMRRAEALSTDGRRRRGLPTGGGGPRSHAARAHAEPVQREVHRLAAANGDPERARAGIGGDGVAQDVGGPGRRRTDAGEVRRRSAVVQTQGRVARDRRRVNHCINPATHTYTVRDSDITLSTTAISISNRDHFKAELDLRNLLTFPSELF